MTLIGYLLEELFFQLVGPPLVGLLGSCQVANVCTLQQHLQACKLNSPKKEKYTPLGSIVGASVPRSRLGMAYSMLLLKLSILGMQIVGQVMQKACSEHLRSVVPLPNRL